MMGIAWGCSGRVGLATKGLAACVCLLLLSLCDGKAFAWSSNSTVNDAVCSASGNQSGEQLVSDGTGGAIITWQDTRNSNSDIYAQRVDSTGAPQWTANGVVICSANGNQDSPRILSDGIGGAMVIWQDMRGSNYDIYAQRVNSAGVVQWAADGVAVCTATGTQQTPQLTKDNAGGAIITWQDYRGSSRDIYAQRINSTGVVQWTVNGVAICTAPNTQLNPQIMADNSGGAVITWEDLRTGSSDHNIYSQRVDSAGAVQWTPDGVAICTVTGTQQYPQLTSDGSGGAIIVWQDFRAGTYDIYSQRVNSAGAVQWAANGIVVCSAANNQSRPRLISVGSSDVIITWEDFRSGTYDIYAQRLDSAGTASWAADGVAIATGATGQANPQIVSDGSDGAIITWEDYDNSTDDIYAQRVTAAGVTQWVARGTAICTAAALQSTPQLIGDGSGGVILTWLDRRNGTGNDDVFVSHVGASGTLPVTLSAIDLE